jgi:hypothetical protein
MKVIEVRNVNHALTEGLAYLLLHGVEEASRNGSVIVAPGPVTTVYTHPQERVLFSPLRDANPFFHLMEALWMMAGRNDVQWPVQFNSKFGQFSDDGATFHGAYGFRWRHWFGYDQLDIIVKELRKNPTSRRCVLAMWDASEWHYKPEGHNAEGSNIEGDLHTAVNNGKDVPCNTHAYLDVRGGRLNITVCCRSNDALWGAYGANAVHFSVLQEVMAAAVGVPVGVYTQVSNNFHAYTDVFNREKLWQLVEDGRKHDLYTAPVFHKLIPSRSTIPLVNTTSDVWFDDLRHFILNPTLTTAFEDQFFVNVAAPMYLCYQAKKAKDLVASYDWCRQIEPSDWRVACHNWLDRRNTNLKTSVPENRPEGI